jgi:cytochrome P450
MKDDELLDEVMTLFVAGHETTAMALSWTLLVLGEHPDVQRKLRAELVRLGPAPAWDELLRLPYPRMVVEEAMRLYPPVWSFPRRATEDDEIGGYRVPRGTFVVLSSYVMHRHPGYWSEPALFRPERFSEEEEKRRPSFTYFPFGAATRHCAGSHYAMIEMQYILASIVRRFELELVPGQRIAPLPLATLKPDRPIRMVCRAIRTAPDVK